MDEFILEEYVDLDHEAIPPPEQDLDGYQPAFIPFISYSAIWAHPSDLDDDYSDEEDSDEHPDDEYLNGESCVHLLAPPLSDERHRLQATVKRLLAPEADELRAPKKPVLPRVRTSIPVHSHRKAPDSSSKRLPGGAWRSKRPELLSIRTDIPRPSLEWDSGSPYSRPSALRTSSYPVRGSLSPQTEADSGLRRGSANGHRDRPLWTQLREAKDLPSALAECKFPSILLHSSRPSLHRRDSAVNTSSAQVTSRATSSPAREMFLQDESNTAPSPSAKNSTGSVKLPNGDKRHWAERTNPPLASSTEPEWIELDHTLNTIVFSRKLDQTWRDSEIWDKLRKH